MGNKAWTMQSQEGYLLTQDVVHTGLTAWAKLTSPVCTELKWSWRSLGSCWSLKKIQTYTSTELLWRTVILCLNTFVCLLPDWHQMESGREQQRKEDKVYLYLMFLLNGDSETQKDKWKRSGEIGEWSKGQKSEESARNLNHQNILGENNRLKRRSEQGRYPYSGHRHLKASEQIKKSQEPRGC